MRWRIFGMKKNDVCDVIQTASISRQIRDRIKGIKRDNKVPLGKKGSSAVMLTMIFVSLIAAVGAIGEAGSRYAAQSQARAVIESAGRSVLASYYSPLKDRYGLFGVQRSEEDIAAEIITYTEESLSCMPLTEMKLNNVSVERVGFSLTEEEILRTQIAEYMKYRVFEDSIAGLTEKAGNYVLKGTDIDKKTSELQRECDERDAEAEAEEAEDEEDDGSAAEERRKRKKLHGKLRNLKNNILSIYNRESTAETGYTLKNSRIKDTLPSSSASSGLGELFADIKSLGSVAAAASAVRDSLYVDSYIMSMFNNYLMSKQRNSSEDSGTTQRDSFFNCETEYIICGKCSDGQNYSKVKKYLFTMRLGLNTSFLYIDKAKRSETLALATALTPGPAVPLTQLLIISAWSAFETQNDIRILESGGRVPIVKTGDSWATDLDSLLEEGTGTVVNSVKHTVAGAESAEIDEEKKGLCYEDYLRILLKIVPPKEKLVRIMDLIQINLKGTESESFVMSECCTGFSITASLNKKSIFAGAGNASLTVSMSHSY